MSEKKKCAIFDIDNTIFNSNWVWDALKVGCKSFSECYEKIGDLNIPINSTINLIGQLVESDIRIILLTARPDSDRNITKSNLRRFFGQTSDNFQLIMVGYEYGIDERKAEVLKDIKGAHNILFFMDDDINNRIKATKLGILSLDILEGK